MDSCITLNDEEIVLNIHKGNKSAQDYILNKYKKVVKNKSKSFFIQGADTEDIIQEGMIGLYKAITEFDISKNVSFYAFACLCIERQIINAIKMSTRKKHIPLNLYLSLDAQLYSNNQEQKFIDVLVETKIQNPEDAVISKEEKKYIQANMISSLSKLEYEVLYLYLQDKSYIDISKIINRDEKSIDNAIQRIRKKIDVILRNV